MMAEDGKTKRLRHAASSGATMSPSNKRIPLDLSSSVPKEQLMVVPSYAPDLRSARRNSAILTEVDCIKLFLEEGLVYAGVC